MTFVPSTMPRLFGPRLTGDPTALLLVCWNCGSMLTGTTYGRLRLDYGCWAYRDALLGRAAPDPKLLYEQGPLGPCWACREKQNWEAFIEVQPKLLALAKEAEERDDAEQTALRPWFKTQNERVLDSFVTTFRRPEGEWARTSLWSCVEHSRFGALPMPTIVEAETEGCGDGTLNLGVIFLASDVRAASASTWSNERTQLRLGMRIESRQPWDIHVRFDQRAPVGWPVRLRVTIRQA